MHHSAGPTHAIKSDLPDESGFPSLNHAQQPLIVYIVHTHMHSSLGMETLSHPNDERHLQRPPPPPKSAKKSQQIGGTNRRTNFSAKQVASALGLSPRPQTHLPFGCSVVGVMRKPKISLNFRKKNSIAFGSAPRRQADSQPISPLARPAVSQTETHSLGFLSVADAAPWTGDTVHFRTSSGRTVMQTTAVLSFWSAVRTTMGQIWRRRRHRRQSADQDSKRQLKTLRRLH